ncbi:MAG: AsmA family protein [Halioglobus sp.]
MARFLIILIAIPLILVLMVALLLPLLLDTEKLVNVAATQLKKQTGATLVVNGEAKLSLFPTLRLQLSDAMLTAPGEQAAELKVGALEIGVDLMPLLSSEIEIQTIGAESVAITMTAPPEQPAIDTTNLTDAQLDAFYEKRKKAIAKAADEASTGAAAALPLALNVQRLWLRDVTVTILGEGDDNDSVVQLVELEATQLNLDDRPIPLQAIVALPDQAITIALAGNVSVNQSAGVVALAPLSVTISGVLADPVALTANGQVNISNQIADVQLTVETGPTRGDGRLRYASFESPQIDAVLALNQLNPALLALAGPEAAQEADAPEETSDSSGDEPLPLDAIRPIDTRAQLSVESVIVDVHTITDVKVDVRAVEGVITLSQLSGTVHEGRLAMDATLNGRLSTATVDMRGALTGLNIASALAAMEAEPIASGLANLDFTLAGKGATQNALIENLAGPITLTTEAVELKDIGVEKMLCQAVALVNQESLTAALPQNSAFKALRADLALQGGKLRLNPLTAELEGVSLKGDGNVDLLSQNLKAVFSARLSPDLEKLDPACRINDRYTGIDWPVSCEGNLSGDPAKWCGVDTTDIIKSMATKEVERTLQKEGGKFLDKLFDR